MANKYIKITKKDTMQILCVICVLLFVFNLIVNNKIFMWSIPNDSFTEQFEESPTKTELFDLKRPFVNVYDNNGNQLNVALLSRPFYMDSHYTEFKKIKPLFNILGISSYQEFPNEPFNHKDGYNKTTNKYDYDKWVNMCKGWLHCFKNPEDYLPKNMKNILLSESDFCDTNINKPNNSIKKKYDFIYICHRDDLNDCSVNEWVAFNKNLELAEKCLSVLCKKKKYKVLLIGRSGCKLPEPCENLQIETTEKLDYYDLQKKYDESKCLFIPNIHDASPRVITESLCHNIPCLINSQLVGGWKYITSKTGEVFNDEHDFEKQLDKIMNNYDNYEPRKSYMENYGTIKSGKILKDFIFNIFGDKINIPKEKIEYVTPEFKRINYTTFL